VLLLLLSLNMFWCSIENWMLRKGERGVRDNLLWDKVDKRKWMLLNKLLNNVLSLLFCIIYLNESKKMQKYCECTVESVTCGTAHFWKLCLPKEYSLNEVEKICYVLYISWVMLIQYFNISSDFRGCYLNRILYLHVKCQQQFIDIVLPFIIRVLIVFLIFV